MADEGFVLLKNDGSLPLEEGAKVSIVGKASTNLARGGAGSGAGSISNSVKNQFANGESDLGLDASLKAVGFEVNATATSFFKSASGGRDNGNDGWKGNSEVTIGETPISSITSNAGLMDSLDEYNDAILQVITREGSEGCDVKTCNTSDTQKKQTPVLKQFPTNTLLNYPIMNKRCLMKSKNIPITLLLSLTLPTFLNVINSKMMIRFLVFYGLVTQAMLVHSLSVEFFPVKSTHLVVQLIHGQETSLKIQHSKTSPIMLKQIKWI
jgi:hypothetical protein